ncbi:hypothetical protein [Gracilibacillus kekensis]|uniref:Uncharacterized protein n=1 Tax=Gracilibacillus kekensis TaxID=1027249 RepID=A0A1M7PND5_9BACI|nr:hypothetical protein [Gracilibacillus kekensis]SHN18765.1 hypothetical protein SAMN05216179_2372 [Gracilibacillus kekensis]
MNKLIKVLLVVTIGVCSIFILIGIVSFSSISKTENQLPIEMIAFNSLSDEESDLIPASPKDSIVKNIPVNNEIKKSISKTYNKDKVYSVTFNHTETDTTGNLVIFVGLDKKTVVGSKYQPK